MVKWVKILKTEKALEIQQARLTEACGEVKSEKANCLLKQHCYCQMLLMLTTKTAVCLQTKPIFEMADVVRALVLVVWVAPAWVRTL